MRKKKKRNNVSNSDVLVPDSFYLPLNKILKNQETMKEKINISKNTRSFRMGKQLVYGPIRTKSEKERSPLTNSKSQIILLKMDTNDILNIFHIFHIFHKEKMSGNLSFAQ